MYERLADTGGKEVITLCTSEVLLLAVCTISVRVVVERLPIGAISIEVEPRGKDLNIEIILQLPNNALERRTEFWILKLEMLAPVHHALSGSKYIAERV